MRLAFPTALLALLLLPGCCECSRPDPAPDPDRQVKMTLVAMVRDQYLWPETLPAQVDLDAHSGPRELLDHLVAEARGQGKDRWSTVLKSDGAQGVMLYDPHAGTTVGFGMEVTFRAWRMFITAVLPGSGAARAGAGRGDEIVALAPSREGLEELSHAVPALLCSGRLGAAFGSGAPGVVRWLRLRQAGTGTRRDLAVTSSAVSLDLVPEPVLLDAEGRKVGYLQLRSFRSPAEPRLRQACARLNQLGATDLIVDLRYNHGGLASTAYLFANLLRGDQGPRDLMVRIRYNANRPEKRVWFQPEPEALRPGRIAFIVTGTTASCGEALPNMLLPYFQGNLALVGSRTHGKPVGMEPRPILRSGWDLYLVSMRFLNARGSGDYFQGLPDAQTWASCAAEDDLLHAPGDPAEASTAAALRWIATGTSAGGPIPPPRASALGEAGLLRQPDPGPILGKDPNRPGLF